MYRNYCLKVSYIGDNFAGWQVQPGFRTAQGVLENLLSKVFKKDAPINIKYPSRTDSGVHAIEQIVSFKVSSAIYNYSEYQLFKILNTQLPYDLKVKEVLIVSDAFNARHSSSKTYIYKISTSSYNDPIKYMRAWWYPHKFDIKRLYEVRNLFLGEQDFKAFMGTGSSVKTTVRKIIDLHFEFTEDEIQIYITANGFLKNMVRNIVGTIMDYARGRFDLEDLKKIINGRNRGEAGICAPPYGLYLYKVYYDKYINDKE